VAALLNSAGKKVSTYSEPSPDFDNFTWFEDQGWVFQKPKAGFPKTQGGFSEKHIGSFGTQGVDHLVKRKT